MKLVNLFLIFTISYIRLIEHISATEDEIIAAENLIFQVEIEFVKEQKEYKDLINSTLSTTILVRSQVRSNENVKKVSKSLNSVVISLRRLFQFTNFVVKIPQNNNFTLCRRSQELVGALESDVRFYLLSKIRTDMNTSFLQKDINELKIQYFANFIFFNRNQSENVLASIAFQERFLEKSKDFSTFLYSSTLKIATVLYDIKVIHVKNCEPPNNKTLLAQTSTSSKKTTSRNGIKF